MQSKALRKIAIFTDAHALLEPTQAALEDIRKRGITEIYSLGDNIGVGPNPTEVMDLLEEHGVISIAGNSEEYITLGLEPFYYYFDSLKTKSHLWTLSKLNSHQKEIISLYPHSIELLMGGKNIALCHFANDVRFDEMDTWVYQNNLRYGSGYEQFLHTNSRKQLQYIKDMIAEYGEDNPKMKGYISALNDPLFKGKGVSCFDAVIQGHTHWKIYEHSPLTDFYAIRALGIAYDKDPINKASYIILTEKEDGFAMDEVLVSFDREKMEYSILNSDSPDHMIYKYAGVKRKLW